MLAFPPLELQCCHDRRRHTRDRSSHDTVQPGQTDLPQYSARTFDSRRRFQDFVFLHDHLMKDFSACVVPPLPSKQRLGASPRELAALA